MLSKVEAGKKIGEDSGSGKLLNEIEAISKALYIDKHTSRSLIPRPNYGIKYGGKTHLPDTNSSMKHAIEEPSRKEKKSIWNWKPLKAFSHIRNRRFNCCFSLQVHSIEGLPSNFDDVSLCVHWKRRDGDLVTRPVKVSQGTVEFEERLTITCSVYGSRSGPHHSAKYEAKHFLLYASVYGAHEIDLGKHRIDLTKLLPLTLEELEEESSSGKWTTSYKLSGKAKGATMNVSFGYTVVGDNLGAPGNRSTALDMLNMRQNNLSMVKSGNKFRQVDGRGRVRRSDSLPNISQRQLHAVEDIKDLHEVLPVSRSELASSVDVLYKKLEEETLDKPFVQKPEFVGLTEHLEPVKPDSYPAVDSGKGDVDNGCGENDFSVIEQGVELSSVEPGNTEEVIVETANVSPQVSRDVVEVETDVQVDIEEDTKICSQDEEDSCNKDELEVQDCISEQGDTYTKESLMKELESALNGVSDLEAAALDSPGEEENYEDIKLDFESDMKGKSLSLDDLTESVANDFLDMLGIEGSPSGLSSGSEPESPRERLLRQFEKEALAGGCPLFGFDLESEDQAEPSYSDTTGMGWSNSTEDEFSSIIQAAEEEHILASQAEMSKNKAKILEDLEAEALMREWGLNERAFQHSPPKSSAGFGSPINLPPEGPPELPPLGEGLGPFLQTKDGGFLRSMTPSHFTNAKNSGNLVMQVSSPVVVPADMGCGIMEILQRLASIGIEKLSMQANKLMPLEDITGKTMQQVAWEAVPSLEGPQSECLMQHEPMVGLDNFASQVSDERSSRLKSSKTTPSSGGSETGSEYVSLEDLAPLAMDKIEALSIEGLRIQSGMSDEEAPSNINAQSIGEISALQGKGINPCGSLGLEGTGGLQLLDIKESSDDVDGIMGLSLTLDEWMRLDSGELDDDENQISERTSKILAAHHAHSLDFIRGGTKGERRKGKGSGRKCGLLGNNFTVALMVQLRDPMRNYEPVGTPMLSLIQVERVFIPPKPKIYSTVSELRKYTEEDDDEAALAVAVKEKIKEEPKEEKVPEEEGIPQYKITEVHVAGLKTEPGKKKLWGNSTQQQSGSRWLVANGMGKSNKNPFLKSKPAAKSNVSKSKAPEATTKVQPGETLWSISSRIHGTGSKWKELAALNPHIRNPNVIFPNETIKLR
ncbi:protein PLASTID MOVEMENT IMPAIRED 1-RELATED 1 [Humulus lupulus]|uniref:protein PLASTID MOVEMENT IMPAIRED 1-RELATED 1 n=1 Tax=Humulus lupulus TaxID=3486 RepID=UPI002B4074F9|nr:protein PLASTID MOVEMENT IMPAIRED 1-RELATED 1 [Humulus lupulus]